MHACRKAFNLSSTLAAGTRSARLPSHARTHSPNLPLDMFPSAAGVPPDVPSVLHSAGIQFSGFQVDCQNSSHMHPLGDGNLTMQTLTGWSRS